MFTSLNPQTKIMLGCGAIAWGITGMFFTSTVESGLGLTPTEEDKEKLKKILPTIRTVDRDQNTTATSPNRDSKS
jgi:hypothetical protein